MSGRAILPSYHHPRGQCRASAQRQHRAPRPLLLGTPPVGFLATNNPISSRSTLALIPRHFCTPSTSSFLLHFVLYTPERYSICYLQILLYGYRITDPFQEPTHRASPSTTTPCRILALVSLAITPSLLSSEVLLSLIRIFRPQDEPSLHTYATYIMPQNLSLSVTLSSYGASRHLLHPPNATCTAIVATPIFPTAPASTALFPFRCGVANLFFPAPPDAPPLLSASHRQSDAFHAALRRCRPTKPDFYLGSVRCSRRSRRSRRSSPDIPDTHCLRRPNASSLPPHFGRARDARRLYLPLRGAAVRRRRGDQRCHVVSFTPTTILATPATLNPAPPLAEALPSPLLVAPGSHSASKPHFKAIAAMLDTTRAVSTSTRHNPFKFDDRSMSNAPYNVIAHAHRFKAPTFMNWLDPSHPLTLRSLPACKRTYFACSWMLKGSKEKGSRRRSYPRPNGADACVPIAASLAPLANDLVFEHPSRTCSAQMRIRISSRVRLGIRAALPDSQYLQSTALFHRSMCEFDACERDMAIPPAHTPFVSPPPVRPSLLPAWPERRVRHALRLPALPAARAGLLQQHDTERDLLSDYEASIRLLDAPRAYDLTKCAVHRPRRRTIGNK
ncbi:hypothetical protein DFH09DRAFT_1364240 [Mycena vulgaris]|nr:hypothetical protein DFH09DRAFT_1364240 [Mycena vulgaris]